MYILSFSSKVLFNCKRHRLSRSVPHCGGHSLLGGRFSNCRDSNADERASRGTEWKGQEDNQTVFVSFLFIGIFFAIKNK
jgi:hypothetical protein